MKQERNQTLQKLREEIECVKQDHVKENKNVTHEKDEYWGCCECYEDKHSNIAIDQVISIIDKYLSK